MNTHDKEWWIAQAGEYVLGTLDHVDRITFQKTIEHDKDAQQLVVEWERTFQPLADSLEPKKPSSRVWRAIDERLFDAQTTSTTVSQIDDSKSAVPELQDTLGRWRGYAGLATAACLLLASLAWVNHLNVRQLQSSDTDISVAQIDAISIIQDEEATPLWVVDAALNEGFIRVTALAPPAIDETNSYELWIVKADDAGVQSMGLIPIEVDQSRILKISKIEEQPVAFAVSLEPSGGSTLEGPSGPVLYQGTFQNLER